MRSIQSSGELAEQADEQWFGVPGWMADSLVVIALLLAAFFGGQAYWRQHEFDGVAEAAVQAIGDQVPKSIAMPWSMHRAVPRLIHSDAHPVLFDATAVSAQGLARRGATHVIVEDGSTQAVLSPALGSPVVIGDFQLYEFEEAVALRTPLPPGRSMIFFESRPYRYRPISDSYVLEHAIGTTLSAFLEAGEYELRLDAYAPMQGTLRIDVDELTADPAIVKLERRAAGPVSYGFSVTGEAPRIVQVSLVASVASLEGGESERRAFLNRVELRRKP